MWYDVAMPRHPAVEVNDLHVILFDQSDRLQRVRLRQDEIAKALGISKFAMSRAVTKMVTEKRMRPISNLGNHRGVFFVEDPVTWKERYSE